MSLLLTDFAHCSGVSIFVFEQANWEDRTKFDTVDRQTLNMGSMCAQENYGQNTYDKTKAWDLFKSKNEEP